MKRAFSIFSALMVAVSISLVGCGDTKKSTTTSEKKGPEGSTKTEVTKETTVKGDGGAANTSKDSTAPAGGAAGTTDPAK